MLLDDCRRIGLFHMENSKVQQDARLEQSVR